MARHGENIRKRVDGRWEGRYKAYCEEKGRYVYRSVYGRTYALAKEKLIVAKLTTQRNLLFGECTGNDEEKETCKNVLFSEVAEEWLEEKRWKCKYSTYIKYETIYRRHLSAYMGTCLLTEVESKIGQASDLTVATSDDSTSDSVDGEYVRGEIFDHLFPKACSESLQKSICCVMNQILRHANQKYGLRILLLKRPALKTRKKTMETFTNSERMRLFSFIYHTPDKYGTAIILCLYTGLRIGELCALRWTDFNFKEMTLTVKRTVQRIAVKNHPAKTTLMEMEPKSESSRRTIPISPEIAELLANLDKDKPYVFGGEKSMEPRTLQYRFKKMLAMAKIDDRNFHMLRHTFATSCVESGMDVKSLSEILGHSDVKITMNRYVHPTMDSKRKQLGMLAGFYGQIHGQVA